uniref:NADH-ubiquinone oxidoreductase chain 3 n=1 Tax=Coelophthinia sp. 1 JPL-2022a TaxID=3002427 RepID=A0A9E8MI36_9DIPT|nr:NADH dehydrogenase subunit 3 [Coelophthinia sp. 1 JPL-2022a]
MLSLMTISIIILCISIITMSLASILSKKSHMDREKCSPFECGFDPKSSSRIPFSLRFFLITIIFLIFDVEIVLLMPLIVIMNYSTLITWMTTSTFFIIILLLGLYHEWNQGALEWSY